jgi:translation initiation factor eIF-2B subunit gamma
MSKPTPPQKFGHSEVSFERHNSIYEHIGKEELQVKAYETNLNCNLKEKKMSNPERVHCFAFMAPKDTFGVRVNTIPGFIYANKKIGEIWNSICPNLPLISPEAIVKSTQTAEIAVGENTTLSEKTSIKSSVFGVNCMVKEKTRITSCFIMNNVVINEK